MGTPNPSKSKEIGDCEYSVSNFFVRPMDVTRRLVVLRLVSQMFVPLDKVIQEKDDLRSLNLPAMNETLVSCCYKAETAEYQA